MIILLIKIDGFFHEVILTGKRCSKQQLKKMYLQTNELTYDIRELPNVFCRIHNFEQIPYDSKIEVDFVIDTDTDIIYSPSY